jgi:hypothetical protein
MFWEIIYKLSVARRIIRKVPCSFRSTYWFVDMAEATQIATKCSQLLLSVAAPVSSCSCQWLLLSAAASLLTLRGCIKTLRLYII